MAAKRKRRKLGLRGSTEAAQSFSKAFRAAVTATEAAENVTRCEDRFGAALDAARAIGQAQVALALAGDALYSEATEDRTHMARKWLDRLLDRLSDTIPYACDRSRDSVPPEPILRGLRGTRRAAETQSVVRAEQALKRASGATTCEVRQREALAALHYASQAHEETRWRGGPRNARSNDLERQAANLLLLPCNLRSRT